MSALFIGFIVLLFLPALIKIFKPKKNGVKINYQSDYQPTNTPAALKQQQLKAQRDNQKLKPFYQDITNNRKRKHK
ncbi:MAG: hypothetical protein NTZ59_02440 [Bacteroidetes bacterium]|nr:hypothetical protein [Bacteroidota bacterium]